jgi:organic hydroperoxide reductase OsmC/OhrA
MKRFGSATWSGGLREGKGSVSTESRALETYPYTFFSRYGEKPGTNPEELLALSRRVRHDQRMRLRLGRRQTLIGFGYGISPVTSQRGHSR